MKTIKKLIFSIIMCLCLICVNTCIFPQMTVEAATNKPVQVTNVTVNRKSGTALTVSWDRVNGASGYEVYMAAGNSGYKKISTTKNLKCTKKGLKIGKAYKFKVRAYVTNNKKKIYGSYSAVVKKKLTSYEYLVNIAKPYDSRWYEANMGSNSLKMASNTYYNSFSLRDGNRSFDGYAYFNLNGKFKKMEFYLGEEDGKQHYSLMDGAHEIVFKGDDEIIKTIEMEQHALPKKYNVNIKGVYKLEIRYNNYGGRVGFGRAKLYF